MSLSKNSHFILPSIPQGSENESGVETKVQKGECCRRLAMQVALVKDIARIVFESVRLDDLLNQACQSIRRALDCELIQIWSAGSKPEELLLMGSAARSPGLPEPLRAASLPPRKCQWRDLMIGCEDISSVAVVVVDLANPRSRISIPLRLHDRIIGLLSLEQSGLRSVPEEQVALLENVASLVSTAFEKFRVLPHAERANDYMQALLNAAQDVAILSTDVHGYVLMASEGTQSIFRITPQEIVGRDVLALFSDPEFQQEVAGNLGSFAFASPLKRRRLVQLNQGIESYLDVTMQEACDSQNHPFGLLFIVTDVTQNVLMQKRLETLASTDDLTGLYNQRRFISDLTSEIDRGRRFQRTCSLGFVDIDGLRRTNTARGHRAGDQILREAASLIGAHTRANAGSCYRYGGDEFTILLPEVTKQAAKILLEQLREQLKEHFCSEITASIGIAEWTTSMEPEDLIEAADRAMYNAKSRGGNCTEMANCRETVQEPGEFPPDILK